jgi:acyl dehydratase
MAVGDEIPSLSKVVLREDVLAYADASMDHNPLHLDDEFAKQAGFDGMIAHGMFTMAHLTTCLTDWLIDPSALKSVRVLFRSAVSMGDTITAGGRVLSSDPSTKRLTLEVWVSVERDGQDKPDFAIRRSRAEVELA